MPANILVGCGGTGIKTLLKVNELLCQDRYWRTYMHRYVYYVAIDTDQKELEKFESKIREQSSIRTASGQLATPYYRTVVLSKGLDHLQPPVNRYFVDPFRKGKDPESRERLLKYWWTDRKGVPFAAPTVVPLSKGAGQCPPVSHFLAWLHLEEIQAIFADMVDQIVDKVVPMQAMPEGANDRAPLSKTNCLVIGSLAGGTGRGCWPLIAYSLRQAFMRRGGEQILMPLAFLLDAECFPEVFLQNRSQEFAMRVNALTGASELASWVRLFEESDFEFRLPSMQRPGERAADILNPRISANEFERSPVNKAHLICSSHAMSGSFDESAQAIAMLGNALYGQMSLASIESSTINDHSKRLNSVGAISFRVPAFELRRYYEAEAHMSTLLQLQSVDENEVRAEVEDCIDDCGLSFGQGDFYSHDLVADSAAGEQNILNQACSRLVTSYKMELDILAKRLDEDDVDGAKTQASSLTKANDTRTSEALATAMREYCGEDDSLAAVLVSRVDAFLVSTQSFAAAQKLCERLIAKVTSALEALPEAGSVAKVGNAKPGAHLAKMIDERAGREWRKLSMMRFSDEEILQVGGIAREMLLRENYRKLHTDLAAAVQAVISALEERKNACEIMLKAAKAVELGMEKPKGDLFVSRSAPLRYLGNAINRVERVLLPPRLSTEAFRSGVRITADWEGFLKEAIASNLAKSLGSSKLRQRLQEEVARSVYLDDVFVESNFSMSSVLTRLTAVWKEYFRSIRNDQAMCTRVSQDFFVYFGFKPRFVDGQDEPEFPEPDEMMLRMAFMIAKQACAYWKPRPGVNVQDAVTIYLPTLTSKQELTRFLPADNKAETDMFRASVYTGKSSAIDGHGVSNYNPFTLLVHSIGKLDTCDLSQISNLDYYREPQIKSWLEACEFPQQHGVFEVGGSSKANHSGFTMPPFVDEPVMAENRWRPWVDSDKLRETRLAKVGRREAFDALAYALMSKSPKVTTKTRTKRWSMPLLSVDKKGKWNFGRLGYSGLEGGKAKFDPRCAWKDGQELAESDRWLLSVIKGEGDRHGKLVDEAEAIIAGLATEAACFWGELVPANLQAEQLDHAAMEFRARLDAAKHDEHRALWSELIACVVAKRESLKESP